MLDWCNALRRWLVWLVMFEKTLRSLVLHESRESKDPTENYFLVNAHNHGESPFSLGKNHYKCPFSTAVSRVY